MLPRIDKEGDNSLFAERLGGFQPVQTFNKHEARAQTNLTRNQWMFRPLP
jgi:hypothetical protein